METRRHDRDIISHQFRGQQGGGTSTHVEREIEKKTGVEERYRGNHREKDKKRDRTGERKRDRSRSEREREREREPQKKRGMVGERKIGRER